MTPSIRTFLLINLLLSVTLITSLAIIGNLILAHRDIQTQLDAELIRNTLRMQAFFSPELTSKNLKVIQENLNAEYNEQNLLKRNKSWYKAIKEAESTMEFQLWDEKGKLILRSKNAPAIPLSDGRDGLSTLWLNGQAWRVNTAFSEKNQITVMVAEQSDYRQQLENQLTQDSIMIMLITYPFLGLLIWMIVGRGLSSLKRVANEVRHRETLNLKPVDAESAPSEIEPLITELNSLFARLREGFEKEKRFTADAAHELRTPLAALSAQIQVALREETPEGRNRALLKVLAGVNRSTHVIQQLLTLSRMDPEASIHDPQPVNLAHQATEVAAQLAPEAIAKNIELELLTPDNKSIIMANPTAIHILLRNLVDNAIRYSPENSFVKINIEENENQVILTVMDNGPGIPEELRERVFERFFRVSGTKTTGSGLGLGIVMQIVKLHKAKIELLTPAQSHGLTVKITFARA